MESFPSAKTSWTFRRHCVFQWLNDLSSKEYANSKEFANSKELSVQMTFCFFVGSRNFCHWHNWTHWVATFWTTTAYLWLSRDSHPSFRNLWSALIESPNFFLVVELHQFAFSKRTFLLVLQQTSQSRHLKASKKMCFLIFLPLL